MQPIKKLPRASSRPENRNQRIFTRKETAPPSYLISFPNGLNEIEESLKHCKPIGIPKMVIHHKQPAMIQPKALISPPNMIHNMFPSIRTFS